MYALYSPCRPNVVALVSVHSSVKAARRAQASAVLRGRRGIFIDRISGFELLRLRLRRYWPQLIVAAALSIGAGTALLSEPVYQHIAAAQAGTRH